MFDLWQIMKDGGPLMVPLIACSVIAIAVVIDRFLAFRAYWNIDNRSLRARVLDMVWDGDLEGAAMLCHNTPGPIAAVMLSAIQAYERNQARGGVTPAALVVKEAMDDYSIHAVSAVEKRLSILSTIGNAAPLLGMTGTVTGMIASFRAFAQSSDAAVMAGIAEALVTTATGLVIALIAVIPFNYFTTQADTIDLEIEETKAQFTDTVAEIQAEAGS